MLFSADIYSWNTTVNTHEVGNASTVSRLRREHGVGDVLEDVCLVLAKPATVRQRLNSSLHIPSINSSSSSTARSLRITRPSLGAALGVAHLFSLYHSTSQVHKDQQTEITHNHFDLHYSLSDNKHIANEILHAVLIY